MLTHSRLITVVQIIWFTLNSVGRLAQHLQVTTLELTTLAFILCTIGTSICWAQKPSEIGRGIVLKCDYQIEDIVLAAGDAASQGYRRTPLDFVSRNEWAISLLWAHDQNILRKLHVRLFARRMGSHPINRIPNDNWPKCTGLPAVWAYIMGLMYSSIFVAGWNFPFPTSTERILWRVSSVGTVGFVMIGSPFAAWGFDFYMPRKKKNLKAIMSDSEEGERRPHRQWFGIRNMAVKIEKRAARWRNNSPDHDPELEIPLRILIPMTILCALYSLFRLYFLVEDALALRAQPPGVFKTVNWTLYIPGFS